MKSKQVYDYKIRIKNETSTKWIYETFQMPLSIGDNISFGEQVLLIEGLIHTPNRITQALCLVAKSG